VIVNVIDQQTDLKISTKQVENLVHAVIKLEGQRCDEVNVYLVDTSAICELHEDFFDDPSPTDCISFPLDSDEEEYRILGEVFVCPATAIKYAAEHEGDMYRETSLYLVHSLLHLMGYDDIEDEEIALIRRAEQRHMHNLQTLDLQLHP
jgi:probable rRNA maturation factor